jgi:L-asparaginase
VLVAVGEQVHAAAEATKWHTQNLGAFRSSRGPLAVLDHGQVVFQRPAFRAAPVKTRRLVSEVDLHTMAAGLPCLRAALAASVPVVLVSRCAEGRVAPLYGYEGGGQMLRELGIIFGQDLPGPKARIKLMVALGATSDVAEIRRMFESDALR